MTKPKTFSTALFALLLAARVLALDIYVATNGTGDGSSWAQATNSIAGAVQYLVDEMLIPGNVIVSNGTYTGIALNYEENVSITGKTGNAADVILVGNGSSPIIEGVLLSQKTCYAMTLRGAGGAYGAAVAIRLVNCIIEENTGTYFAGAIAGGIASHCIIRNNTGGSAGAAAAESQLNNCLIYGNTGEIGAVRGGQVYNCTIVGNVGTNGAGGVGDDSLMYNTISWGNTGDPDNPSAAYYSCGSGTAYEVATCITNDPLFIGSGDYRLQAGSPCINAGTNSTWTLTTDTDLDGNKRRWPANGQADMGAYEFGSQPEYLKKVFLMKSN